MDCARSVTEGSHPVKLKSTTSNKRNLQSLISDLESTLYMYTPYALYILATDSPPVAGWKKGVFSISFLGPTPARTSTSSNSLGRVSGQPISALLPLILVKYLADWVIGGNL